MKRTYLAIIIIVATLSSLSPAEGLKVEDAGDQTGGMNLEKIQSGFSELTVELQKELLDGIKKIKQNYQEIDSFMKELDAAK